jgi:hypothetical protein
MLTTQAVDPLRIPTVAGTGAQAEPIQRGGDLSVAESAGHLPNHRDGFRARYRSRLARASLTHSQL